VNEDVKAQLNSHVGELSLLEKVAVSLPGVIFQVCQRPDNSNMVTYVSFGCQELFELKPETVQADFLVLRNLIHPQDIQAFTESFLVSSNTFYPWCCECRIITPSNKLKWIQVTSHPTRQQNGDILWEGLVMDITVRKLAEENLRASEARYKAILDAIPDLIFRISANGEYIDFKGEGANITIPREQIVGKNLWDLLPEDVANSSYAAIRKTLASRRVQTYEYQLPTPIGLRDYEARLVVSGYEEILAIVRDITERKQAETQLHMTLSRNRLLAETLGRIRRSLNLDEILQTTVTEVRNFLQADRVFIALNDSNAQCKVLAESVNVRYPSVLDWKDENPDECLFNELKASLLINNVRVVENITQVSASASLKALYKIFETQATLAVPIILGDELFGALIANQCSSERQWQPVEIDLLQQISEQLAIAIQQAKLYQELAQLNSDLEGQVQERTVQLQQKMQENQELNRIKDVVLHTVSHDLRTSVMGNLMVLNNLVKGETTCRDAINRVSTYPIPHTILERMIQGNERQLGMINSLLEINSSDTKDMIMHQETVQFNILIEAILQDTTSLLTRYQARLNTQISNLTRKNSPLVKADQELLRKVFVSLLTYSCQNNPPGLNFSIKAKMDGDKIRCTIQDDGVVMSKSECDSFFDLHVRDPQNRLSTATSLKLYMCRQIIKAHNGEIGITSNRKGVTYWFTLPVEQPRT
jgi:PAS domain S-box-containing protein